MLEESHDNQPDLFQVPKEQEEDNKKEGDVMNEEEEIKFNPTSSEPLNIESAPGNISTFFIVYKRNLQNFSLQESKFILKKILQTFLV